MVRTWSRLFTPATYALGAALLLFAEAAVEPEPWPWYPVAGALAVALVLHCRAFRPVLGTED